MYVTIPKISVLRGIRIQEPNFILDANPNSNENESV